MTSEDRGWGRKDIPEGSEVSPGPLRWGRIVLASDYWGLYTKEWYVSVGRFFAVLGRFVDPVTGVRRRWVRRGQWIN